MNNTNNFYLIQQTQQQQHLQQQQQQQQQLQQPHHQQNHTTINDLNELVYYWKNFRVQDLKNDFDIYLKHIDSSKNVEKDLTNQLKLIIKSLKATNNQQQLDQTSYNLIIQSFTNQMSNFSNRLKLTENLVFTLINFFSKITEYQNTYPFDNAPLNNSSMNQIQSIENNYLINNLNSLNQQVLKFNNQNRLENHSNLSDTNDTAGSPQVTNPCPYDLANIEIPDETTEQIAKNIKEYLQISKISQTTFAQSLLNMKQANFSFLLSHPSSWSELSKTYRDRFLIMYLWLRDPERMDKLSGESGRDKLMNNIPLKSKYSMSCSSSSLNDFQKRDRMKLTNNQIEKLKYHFIKNPYPSTQAIDKLCIELNIPAKKISTWFTHQRQLNKQNIIVNKK